MIARLAFSLRGFALFTLLANLTAATMAGSKVYRTVLSDANVALNSTGYIIGVEKYKLEKPEKTHYLNQFKPLPAADGVTPRVLRERNEKFSNRMVDQKAHVITHLLSFPEKKQLHNVYRDARKPKVSYQHSLEAIDALRPHLQGRLRDNTFTHVVVMAMGWNNDQRESIRRFNTIVSNTTHAAGTGAFRPLVVGITWPSVWWGGIRWKAIQKIGHITSYANKANDADEIGYTWANYVINKLIPEAVEQAGGTRPKVVVIGHSFGARLLSRALFSKGHLKEASPESPDLFIGLQGAFSNRRFVPGESGEGEPYADVVGLDVPIVLTTSIHDKANPVAFWSKHAGGRSGLNKARSAREFFDVVNWNGTTTALPAWSQKVVVINATSIVNKDNQQGVSGHNDILDLEMGQLVWKTIQRYAPGPR